MKSQSIMAFRIGLASSSGKACLGRIGAVLIVSVSIGYADNVLVNPSFEQNSGHVIPIGWGRFAPPTAQTFGNYWVEGNVTPQQGLLYYKEWGACYNGTNNAAGLYQDVSCAPSSVYQASGWFFTSSTDTLGADDSVWLEVMFLGSTSNLLALYKSDTFTASVGFGSWFQYVVSNACDISKPVSIGDPFFNTYSITGTVSELVAPAGATIVRYRFVYVQAANEGGSCYLDSTVLTQQGFTPIINVSGNLNFGGVVVGNSAQRNLTISNVGNSPLTVSNINYPPGGFSGPWSGQLPPGASTTIAVTFNPMVIGNFTGMVSVVSDAAGGGSSIPISGTGFIPPEYRLFVGTSGGGIVIPDPLLTSYASNTPVTLTAVPAGGWTFLDWGGDGQGTNPVLPLVMNSSKSVQARFGTPVTTTVSGSGSVLLLPDSPVYPYNTPVWLVAQPQPGNYFLAWTNGITGDLNPFNLLVQDNLTASALFAPLAADQFALTVIPDGYGYITASPYGNAFTNGQTVTITAVPNPGQEFTGWSGDATGTSSMLVVTMDQSKTITGSFTKRPLMRIEPTLDETGGGAFNCCWRVQPPLPASQFRRPHELDAFSGPH